MVRAPAAVHAQAVLTPEEVTEVAAGAAEVDTPAEEAEEAEVAEAADADNKKNIALHLSGAIIFV